MPIIAAMRLVNDTTSITLARSAMRPSPMTMLMMAMKIGSAMASSDPKASRSMIMAARIPTASVPPGGVRVDEEVSAEGHLEPGARRGRLLDRVLDRARRVPLGRLLTRTSSWISAKATRPSADICRAPWAS